MNPAAGALYYLSREEKRRDVEIAVEECSGNVMLSFKRAEKSVAFDPSDLIRPIDNGE